MNQAGVEFQSLVPGSPLRSEAAGLLHEVFCGLGIHAWPDRESALQEVDECAEPPSLCMAMVVDGTLAGWAGLRPLYEKTWELHPMVVARAFQGRGLGRRLLAELEGRARNMGLEGIVLGTDDESCQTSLSRQELHHGNILEALGNLTNPGRHPCGFYERCGYAVVGVIPHANGRNKPDIWMWKDLST